MNKPQNRPQKKARLTYRVLTVDNVTGAIEVWADEIDIRDMALNEFGKIEKDGSGYRLSVDHRYNIEEVARFLDAFVAANPIEG